MIYPERGGETAAILLAEALADELASSISRSPAGEMEETANDTDL